MIDGGGIAVDLPAGWDAEIYQRTANTTAGGLLGVTEQTNAVMHAANFALPTVRGDFGSGAVELMRDEDLLIVLFEYNSDDASAALFEHVGIPLPLTIDDFDPNQMQRALQGLAGCQRFFNEGGRAWCLYVVAAQIDLENLVATANEVLGSLSLGSL